MSTLIEQLRRLLGIPTRREGPLGWLGHGGHERHQIGWRAERYAAEMLVGRGYHILERNLASGPGEIDLIAEHDDEIVCIEVRSRAENGMMRPVETVRRKKRGQIGRCARAYLRKRGVTGVRHHFEVAEVYLDERRRPMRLEMVRIALKQSRR